GRQSGESGQGCRRLPGEALRISRVVSAHSSTSKTRTNSASCAAATRRLGNGSGGTEGQEGREGRGIHSPRGRIARIHQSASGAGGVARDGAPRRIEGSIEGDTTGQRT